MHAVLKKKFNTIATKGNLNNHIGVPLTLLSLNENTEFGIVEMGANHPLEIKTLCEIAQPDFGYITNFGKAHLEGFGSVEGVIKAKSELYDYLKENQKLLFLNADDEVQKKQLTYKKVFSFGQSELADVRVEYPSCSENAGVESEKVTYNSLLTGSYNAINIAAAICIGTYFKIAPEHIQKAIAAYSPQNNRSQILRIGNITLIMDAYNANPTSMMAALESFSKHPAKNKAVILGDMFELGKDSEKEHQAIVNHLERSGFKDIFLTGKNFYRTQTSAENISKFESFEELKSEIITKDLTNTFILIKGSRGMALERIVDFIK
ncbi:UDP-N-acetylmuramoyl-tripeptide--D-alanyl-D-alanine ligase [Antarcticibacterium sp. 1MA-6-2]|uniref:UDP-N-acetylmuramoyl-tripeptide--D-alanyl-D- alanine ligase n=1 Tax=Antarcticibacterium sp. 1MA-6-2 TaxID=2908210 RepID=UPI002882E4FD|nr:UDP-N-acetylmuramoyl-tripeptide--D-alanyl-D-alanine ligase [Antarcticibacterium sp. 1MA-6-2]